MGRQALHCFVVVAAIALAAAPANARVIRVPADRPTIQQAINASVNGDTVRVSPGLYFEKIDFLGKVIVVTSESGPALTTIDGDQNGSAVQFFGGETLASQLIGFTIQHGTGDFSSGGISISNSSPTIRGNVIRECSGSGIRLANSQGLVESNVIDHNNGSGISIGAGAPTVQDNTISFNTAGDGGGIRCGDANARVFRNHIKNNNASFGGGMSIVGGTTPLIEGNLFEENT